MLFEDLDTSPILVELDVVERNLRGFRDHCDARFRGRCAPTSRITRSAVPATKLALEYVGRPVPNVPRLGGFAAISGVISLDAVISAIKDRFSG